MKVIITGASGMVGEGVLHECIHHNEITHILLLSRKKIDYIHPKVNQLVIDDLYNISPDESRLRGYDACYFCLGTTSVGKTDEEYYKITYTLTMNIAQACKKQNEGMTFCYISGSGTDSSEKGRLSWARTKGKVENDLQKLGFKAVYNFRPGYLQPTAGLKNTLPYYKYISWLFPLVKYIPGFGTKLSELGQSMINVSKDGYHKSIIEVSDILKTADK